MSASLHMLAVLLLSTVTALAAWQQQELQLPDVNSVPTVFTNGAWDHDHPAAPLNAYIASLLSKDVYYKHVVDPKTGGGALSRRNFTTFASLFCHSMQRLGADECEAIEGTEALVWALVRAGPSVMLVIRGSNSPENWITDVTSLRTTNVGDFGGGASGTNVAAGFYKVFNANRRDMVARVQRSMGAAAAAAKAKAATATGSSIHMDGDGAPGPRLWVFGHSLGGAVALMAAAFLDLRSDLAPTGVFTFGCPRVGDATWARAYRLHTVTQRLENAGDIVPTLPFGGAWRHVGSAVPIHACRAVASAPLTTVAQAAGLSAGAGRGDDEAAAVELLLRFGGQQQEEQGQQLQAHVQVQQQNRWLLRAGAVSSSLLLAEEAAVGFPFPFLIIDHMIQTYVTVIWSCLPDQHQSLVPGPEDVYEPMLSASADSVVSVTVAQG